ncbi:MBL fold metallo-hydrolase [Carnobacterium gallinarum]|uniref:MBL fold metallo-hydrolase n=1 Tax=Carnobacterium gallinarum TaxID=2749 RepID=UPI0005594FDB|nr:MBL fold metallo-hydrolase [Carnobacterium gallinarum]
MLKVIRIKTGTIEENCYILSNQKNCIVVDPGNDADKIIATIATLAVTPVAILLTHAHFDHIGALEDIRNHFKIPVYIDPAEQSWLGSPELNLSERFGQSVIANPAEFDLAYQKYDLEGIQFKVVPTPGHSIGSVSFIFDDFVVVGDALFKGSIGRTDLPNASFQQLIESINTELFTLPDNLVVYPGHGDDTTIGIEKTTNPHFN